MHGMLYAVKLKDDLGQGLIVVIQAISSLEVDSKSAIPVLSEGAAILHSPHQAAHLDIALRASGLSGRATALVLCLCMYQIACSEQHLCPCMCQIACRHCAVPHTTGRKSGVMLSTCTPWIGTMNGISNCKYPLEASNPIWATACSLHNCRNILAVHIS